MSNEKREIEELKEEVVELEEELLEVEIEVFALEGKPGRAPKAKHYVIRVNKEKFTVDVPEMSGRQILELAGKTPPEQFKLQQKHRGGVPAEVGLDQTVDFRAPGVERFISMKRDHTEG